MPAFGQGILSSILAAKYVFGQGAIINAHEEPVQLYTFRYTIPAVVGNTVASSGIHQLAPLAGVERRLLPESIRHISWNLPKKSMADKIKMLQDKFEGESKKSNKLAWNGYLYRGLGSFNGAANSLRFLTPFLSTICARNLSPSFYLTPFLETAIFDYAGSQGEIFVFQGPELYPKEVNVSEPTIAEWKTVLAANAKHNIALVRRKSG